MPSMIASSETQTSSSSVPARLLNMWVSPSEVFDEVLAAPPRLANWLAPTLLVCLASLLLLSMTAGQEQAASAIDQLAQEGRQLSAAQTQVVVCAVANDGGREHLRGCFCGDVLVGLHPLVYRPHLSQSALSLPESDGAGRSGWNDPGPGHYRDGLAHFGERECRGPARSFFARREDTDRERAFSHFGHTEFFSPLEHDSCWPSACPG